MKEDLYFCSFFKLHMFGDVSKSLLSLLGLKFQFVIKIKQLDKNIYQKLTLKDG